MTIRPDDKMRPLRDGEAVFFTREPAIAAMMAVLCSVSGKSVPHVPPRLILCDGDDTEMQAAALRAAPGVPLLLYTRDPAAIAPPENLRHCVLPRPFSFPQFREAVCALLSEDPPVPAAAPASVLEGSAAVSGGVRVPLTPREADILAALIAAYPETVPKARLEALFDRRGGNSVSVYVSYLRRKLSPLPAFHGILSVRGGGFSLVLNAVSDGAVPPSIE